jgi:5-methylcytosine-specific restriction endonuclease McrA
MRQRVIRRDRFKCQLRYTGCTFRAEEAHHVSYERFGGNERDSDLVASCRNCNLAEREQRIVRRVMGGIPGRG